MVAPMIRPCANPKCSNSFTPNVPELGSEKKYCSSACREKTRYTRQHPPVPAHQPRSCERCGKEYNPSAINQKFCSKNCKHLKSKRKRTPVDALTAGERFGNLILINRIGADKNSRFKHNLWLCRCDCGKECSIRSDKLRSGRAKSCGCMHLDRTFKAAEDRRLRE